MAKQRGGSPFTDSWFEMPFWFLFFLLIITVILLWQFGVFNKPAPVAIAKIIPGQTLKPNIAQPELTIEEVTPHPDGITVTVSYSTKYTTDGQFVAIRMDEYDKAATPFKNFPVGKKTVTVHGYRSPQFNKRMMLEAYIVSADGSGLSPLIMNPFMFESTQPGARNSSASSDPLPSASSGPGKKAYTSPSLVGTH